MTRYRLARDGNGIEKERSGRWWLDLAPPQQAIDLLAPFRGSGERGDEDFQPRLTTSVALPF